MTQTDHILWKAIIVADISYDSCSPWQLIPHKRHNASPNGHRKPNENELEPSVASQLKHEQYSPIVPVGSV